MHRPVYVVVDVGAVRRSVGAGLDPGVVVHPDKLTELLGPLGLHVADVTLVSADAPLPGATDELVALADELAAAQLDQLVDCQVPARQLSAFIGTFVQHDGRAVGELAVDGLLVTASLQYAREVADGRRPPGIVVLLSDDPDVWICHRYPVEVPFVYAGDLTADARCEIDDIGGRWLHLPPTALAVLAGAPSEDVAGIEVVEGGLGALSTAEISARWRAAERWEGGAGAASVAVVDLADVFRNAVASLGAAQLPGPDEVRRLVAQLAIPAPTAAYATIPDLPDELLPSPDDPASIGWRLRDAQFAQAEAAYTGDDDPATRAGVGELIIERQAGGHYHVVGQRRLATAVVADAWWAAASNPSAVIAVLSDRWDVVALQWHARDLGLTEPRRLTRVGTQVSTIAGLDLSHIVLPDDLLAELVRAPAPRAAVADQHGASRWYVEDVSLVTRSATLVAVGGGGDPQRGVRLDSFDERVTATELVAGIPSPDDREGPEVRRARVIGYREPAAVVLDAGTGSTVTVTATGPLPRRGEIVGLVADRAGRRWFVGQPTSAPDPTQVEVPRPVVIERGGEDAVGRPVDGDRTAPLVVLPGEQPTVGQVVLAVRRGSVWRAISSPLIHLAGTAR